VRLTLRCSQEAHGQRATAAGGAAEEAEVNHGGGGFTSKEKNEDLSMLVGPLRGTDLFFFFLERVKVT
jgi:hypothetical protein